MTNNIPTAPIALTVREDLHETNRYNEDGERIIRSTFYVVATDARGRRWASGYVHREHASANGERRHYSGRDGHAPAGFDPIALGWGEIDPMYGSEAWGPEAEMREIEREREAERWGSRW